MEDWMNLIELVDSTSGRRMCYLVALLDGECFTPNPVGCGEGRVCEMEYFSTAEETIQFLSERELFGFEVKSYVFNRSWNEYEEMRIELYRRNRK